MGESKYSDYYDIRESDATCKTCGKILQMKKNNTKGLKYHAEKKHNINFDDGEKNREIDFSKITDPNNPIVIMKIENDSDDQEKTEENFEDQSKKPFKCTELSFLGIECEKR